MRTLTALLVLLAVGAAPAQDAKELGPKVDALVDAARKKFDVPGCAVVVIRDDQVVHRRGYGVRRLDGNDPVDEDTIFAIASMTKPITAFLLALLVAEGKVDWDDPVRKHLPALRLADPIAERDVTIRDLLCHRTGLPRHDYLWSPQHAGWDRDELIRRLAFVAPTKSFRSEYQYNNLMFLVAGQVAGQADGGRGWEASLQARVLGPLGMTSTVVNGAWAEKAPNAASPHFRFPSGDVRPIAFRNLEPIAPAGALHASAKDLTGWLRMQLAGGTLDGKRLVAEKLIREMHRPHVVVPDEGPLRTFPEDASVQATYGLGWSIRDYRGYRVVAHSGSIDGFTSTEILIPRTKLAIAVLNNRQGSPLPGAVAFSIADEILGLEKRDWINHFHGIAARAELANRTRLATRDASRKADAPPAVGVKAFVGTYAHAGYGELHVEPAGDGLRVRWGRYEVPLRHFHHETYVLGPSDHVWRPFADETLVFRLSPTHDVESVQFVGQTYARARAK